MNSTSGAALRPLSEVYKPRACRYPKCRDKAAPRYFYCTDHLEIFARIAACSKDDQLAYWLRPSDRGKIGSVYAIRDGDAVKFGVTHGEIAKRVAAIQSHNVRRISLIGSLRASYQVEQDIHAHLKDLKIHGEWFRWEARSFCVAQLIKANDLLGLLQFMGVEINPLGHPIFDPST